MLVKIDDNNWISTEKVIKIWWEADKGRCNIVLDGGQWCPAYMPIQELADKINEALFYEIGIAE